MKRYDIYYDDRPHDHGVPLPAHPVPNTCYARCVTDSEVLVPSGATWADAEEVGIGATPMARARDLLARWELRGPTDTDVYDVYAAAMFRIKKVYRVIGRESAEAKMSYLRYWAKHEPSNDDAANRICAVLGAIARRRGAPLPAQEVPENVDGTDPRAR